MSKLTEHAEKEYRIIREYIDAVEAAHTYQPSGPLREFSQYIKKDLQRILELHSDNNNLKKKYYRQRAVILDSEAQIDRPQLVHEMKHDDIAQSFNDMGEEYPGT